MGKIFLKYGFGSMRVLLPLVIFLAMPVCAAGSDRQTSDIQQQWHKIESGNFTVYYSEDINSKSLSRRLNIDFIRTPFFKKPSLTDLTEEEILIEKVKYIFNKVESILGMYPHNAKVQIKIFKTKEELRDAYFDIFKKTDKSPAFYVHKFSTVYTYERGLTENLLAHEMAHCIMDNYFQIAPPLNTAEIIAGHVDLYLKD